MIKSLFKYIVCLVVYILSTSSGMNYKYQPQEFLVNFNENEIELTTEGEKMIGIANEIIQENNLTESSYILIGIYPLYKEIKKDKYIGYKRAKNVIQFFVKEYNYSYSNFRIVDRECCNEKKGCKPSISISLEQKW
jgi:hypothetical protein